MYIIKAKDIVTVEQKLLFNIWESLDKKAKLVESPKILDCKYCGGTHENKGQLLACAKKHKKGAK